MPNCFGDHHRRAIGICDMFWTPPATTRSCVPAHHACAAKCTACCDEPHWRSIVVPGTSSGRPAASQHVRAMSPACVADRVDAAEDHVVDGGRVDARALDERLEHVRAHVGGMLCAEATPRRPTGVRTASMMYASAMYRGAMVEHRGPRTTRSADGRDATGAARRRPRMHRCRKPTISW
jgi:hypothetical protein